MSCPALCRPCPRTDMTYVLTAMAHPALASASTQTHAKHMQGAGMKHQVQGVESCIKVSPCFWVCALARSPAHRLGRPPGKAAGTYRQSCAGYVAGCWRQEPGGHGASGAECLAQPLQHPGARAGAWATTIVFRRAASRAGKQGLL